MQINAEFHTLHSFVFICSFILSRQNSTAAENCWHDLEIPYMFGTKSPNCTTCIPLSIHREFETKHFSSNIYHQLCYIYTVKPVFATT